ncbi:S41 family peptidase [Belliella kenyensis]|uniref:S41 family peptidase n=1 Tax=Belliella kenyensis TaxID=1472724 RepID=UPI0025B4D1F7|nr:S41 family peptidase [Belliella kenyensis]MDN3602768.1 S41 family peptidase [Belliella kenyensis]
MISHHKISLLILVLFSFSLTFNANAQSKEKIGDFEKYKQFGLVWGLMKYHHPIVSKGEYNWDEKFVENIKKLDDVLTKEDLDHFLLQFITSIDSGKIKASNNFDGLFMENYDYDWIEFYKPNNLLYGKLKDLKSNTNIKNYYISNSNFLSKIPKFDNEVGFETFDSDIKSHRLLTLFSFWNLIQYYYVNKYLIQPNWFDLLDDFVPEFADCKSDIEYEKVKHKMIASINDSHTSFISQKLNDLLFSKRPPFGIKLVNDTLVVTALFNVDLTERDDIKLGDRIVSLEDETPELYLSNKLKYVVSASNDSYLKRNSISALRSGEDSIKVTIDRNDTLTMKYIKLHKNFEIKDYVALPTFLYGEKWGVIDENVGYINLHSITKKEVKSAFKDLSKTQGIIFDLRNYPKHDILDEISKNIYPERKKFVQVLAPITNRPSLSKIFNSPIRAIVDPFKSGRKNSKFYDGKVILLVNHSTQSKAEFIGMAIQAAPNCVTVGDTTSGALMNVSIFTLPDLSEILFTSLGGFYPNGAVVQGKGLNIDYYVQETTSNFVHDQYILKGIELIKSSDK